MTHLTYNQALTIQQDQLNRMLRGCSRKFAMTIREELWQLTGSCATPDAPLPLEEINRLVPRGTCIQDLIARIDD